MVFVNHFFCELLELEDSSNKYAIILTYVTTW